MPGRDDHESADDGPSSADVFGLVGNEIRADIIRVFGDARVEERHPPVLTFSELRSRTDTTIDSSRFNYHLQQLVGHYLERVDEGYRMRPPGRALYQTIRAGTFEGDQTVHLGDAGFTCHYCETMVEASIDAGNVVVRCPECEYVYAIAGAPPGAGEDGSVDLAQIGAFYHHRHLAFARGICVTCGNEPGLELVRPGGLPFSDADRQKVYVYRSCENCGDQRHLSLGTALAPNPAVTAFCLDHGVDVLSTPLWELTFAATDRFVTVHSSDPWEVALEITYDDDTLELVVDGELNIVEQNHR